MLKIVNESLTGYLENAFVKSGSLRSKCSREFFFNKLNHSDIRALLFLNYVSLFQVVRASLS